MAVSPGRSSGTPQVRSRSSARGGGVVGSTLGYNLQFQNIVIGVETDFDSVLNGQNGKQTKTALVPLGGGISETGTITTSSSLDWLDTLRARAGYLVTPNLLIFATGGFAVGQVELNTQVTNSMDTVPSPFGIGYGATKIRPGWAAGGGAEWKMSRDWSLKLDYLRYDLGTQSLYGGFAQLGAGGDLQTTTGVTTSTHFGGNLIRVGFNSRFDFSEITKLFPH